MGRPKGFPKTGGRLAGTPNKNTQGLMARLESLGCDPIEGLAKIAMAPETKPDLQVRCYAELAQYVYPKRKAIDLSTGEDRNMTVVIQHIGADPP